ncbi:MAG: DUF4833 domain-containing protein [Bacteroidota bacterium]|nr:DUF4833 domain-containing protein [Bacteroidota bacterium]
MTYINLLFYIILLFNSIGLNGKFSNEEKIKNDASYPTPLKTDKLLFYIQRSHNKNTIAYDINFSTEGKINTKEPIHPYWIRFEEGGNKAELSFIQRKYAYGLDCKLVDKDKESFIINFVCYHKRNIYLLRTGENRKYNACIYINGKLSILNKIFFKYDGGPFWFPKITYIDIFGNDLKTGAEITERFVP